MAVTYSWRIDTNKYAYIVPPATLTISNTTSSGTKNNNWRIYGYLSTTPLTDYFAKTVADGAESLSKEDYFQAFKIMQEKINEAIKGSYYQKLTGDKSVTPFNWMGIKAVDFVSADDYYSVEASQCADLRGVGIKGIRYLGSCPPSDNKTYVDRDDNDNSYDIEGVDLHNLSYVPSGSSINGVGYMNGSVEATKTITIKPGIPGFTDVYGIFMSDVTDEQFEGGSIPPERMFVIRNGKEGVQGTTGASGATGESGGVSSSDFNTLQVTVGNINGSIDNINKSISAFTESYNGLLSAGWGGVAVEIENMKKSLNDLTNKVSDLQASGGENNGGNSGGNSGGGGFGSSIEILKIPGTTGSQNEIISGDIDLNTTGDTVYLLGYLMTSDDVINPTAKPRGLYALPYLRVNGNQIDFDGNVRVGGTIQGNQLRSENNLEVRGVAISSGGFYQEEVSNSGITKNNTFSNKDE